MKKTKSFDAVKFMRDARELVYQETKDMSPQELLDYYSRLRQKSDRSEKKAGHGT